MRNALTPFLLLLLAALALPVSAGEEKKPEPPKNPELIMAVPPVLIGSEKRLIKLRGLNLGDATAVQISGVQPAPTATIKNKGKADIPKDFDVKKCGDTQVEVEFEFPKGALSEGTLAIVVVTPKGPAPSFALPVVAGKSHIEENEPNNGFKKPNDLWPGVSAVAQFGGENDVDVFRVKGKKGQTLRVRTEAVKYKSIADPLVTLYDARGTTLAVSDDQAGSTESLLNFALPADGDYFISATDANARGGPIYSYVLMLGE